MSESGEGRVVVEGDETAVTMLDVLQDEQELEDAGQNQDGAESYYEVRARQQNEIEEAKKVQKVNRERKADHDSAKQTLLAWLGSLGLTPEQLAEHERQINGEGGAIWDPRSV